jgi:hypothetical protein
MIGSSVTMDGGFATHCIRSRSVELPPDVSYARSGDIAIAYQVVVGEGRTDVVFVRGIAGDLLSTWEQPLLVRHVRVSLRVADC